MGDIPYNMIYAEGDRLVLQLKNEMIFEGDYCDGGTNNIDLINARQHNNSNVLGGLYSFYRNEIQCIYYFKECRSEKRFKKFDGDEMKGIDLTEVKYNALRQIAANYIYIQRADSKYFSVVKKLSEAENISVMPFGMKISKSFHIKFLAICTWKEVVLFDLGNQKNKYFYPELREILESEYTCKVMHKGSPLINMFFHSYQIYVQNTFDTQVVDLILQKRQTGKCPNIARTLPECLIEYLNLPSCFLNTALEACEKSWDERPLRDDQLKGAAQQVTYLMSLKHAMEKILTAETYATICKVHNFCTTLQNSEFTAMCQNNEVPDKLAELIPILPQLKVEEETEEEETKTQAT